MRAAFVDINICQVAPMPSRTLCRRVLGHRLSQTSSLLSTISLPTTVSVHPERTRYRRMSYINKPVPGVDQYYPLNEPSIGTAYPKDVYPQNAELPVLFQPLSIRGVTFNNRILVSPMCQYSSDDGHATDWHLVHIGGYATRGLGAICMEATAVVPEGRISPEDAGLWTDSQIAPLKRIVNFAHAQGTKIGIQLAHAGRKASTYAPWVHSNIAKTRKAPTYVAGKDEGGWPDRVYGPSEIPFSDLYPKPSALTATELSQLVDAFVKATERSKEAGFDFIEIHGAHGYLLHEFVSPLSNDRTDEYGGSLENRLRFPLEVARKVRAAWGKPLFVRISAVEWAEGPEKDPGTGEWKQWGIEQSKVYVSELKKIGVDLVDCSTGGNWVKQKIPIGPGYQVPFAEALKKAHPDLLIGAVGAITEPEQAESYLRDGKADVIFMARELIRNPHWPIYAAQKLGVAVKPANQYERGWVEMLTPARPGQSSHDRGGEQGTGKEHLDQKPSSL
ncbi:FMN-linked oxidoreductase [Trametes polyzona]|nr:FMN-linked oxidoreductase [Trametes polyzona]